MATDKDIKEIKAELGLIKDQLARVYRELGLTDDVIDRMEYERAIKLASEKLDFSGINAYLTRINKKNKKGAAA